jgi:hypothetical protein
MTTFAEWRARKISGALRIRNYTDNALVIARAPDPCSDTVS